jgi:hypothetical protein
MTEEFYIVENILTEEECSHLAIDILANALYNPSFVQLDIDDIVQTACGIKTVPKTAINLWDGLTDEVKRVTGKRNLVQSSIFSRIYRNGSTLNEHVDKKGLDWTLTIPLFCSIEKDWPIYVRLSDSTIATRQNILGGGPLFKARNLSHWRDPLLCSDYEFSVHLFMHWEEI